MAKRELSSNLKSMKFMQRAMSVQKVEKTDKEIEEVVKVEEKSVSSTTTLSRKCIVIMEGNPLPGALKGRMSFQSFNPSIDKLTKEAEDLCQPQMSTANSVNQTGRSLESENGFSQSRMESSQGDHDSDEALKRKKPEMESPIQPQSNPGIDEGSNPQKRGKLDWRVLRPPKSQTRMD